ncbi:anti-repressor protein [Brevibacterium antiquum]|uniref:Anti-repressor protein n=2 Tax=Brevibacterium antiquum TaxID=234835 RepID=A0A2H1IMI3_9MICO|nr:anti-repressor protein [Brevibacterium antiquum]
MHTDKEKAPADQGEGNDPERDQHMTNDISTLIPIRDHDGQQVASGRDLHAYLGVNSNYTTWFDRMVGYGFIEGQDFIALLSNSGKQVHGGANKTDHAVTFDMAKELGMIQRTPEGKRIRQYFIEAEKKAAMASAPKTYLEALKVAAEIEESRLALEAQVEADKPKVIFADAVSTSKSSILVGELAKLICANGVNIGQNRLFTRLRSDGFLIRRKGTDWNMPTQRSMDMGLFRVKETAVTHSDGHVSVNKTPKVTGKGQQYFINYFLSDGAHGGEAA